MISIDTIVCGDCLEVLKTFPDESINCCITSPPYYGLRDYGVEGQIGHEKTPEEYVNKVLEVFREVRRVLRKDGTLWLNLGDSYVGSGVHSGGKSCNKGNTGSTNSYVPPKPGKSKDLLGIPWMVAFALRADGWFLRSDIIWHKPNCMPESVTDRPTKSHEYIFLLSKCERYYYDSESIKEQSSEDFAKNGHIRPSLDAHFKNDPVRGRTKAGLSSIAPKPTRNKRDVWTVNTHSFPESHFATFPEALVEPCIKAGCPEDGIILDPFFGAGTIGLVARKLLRHWIGIELNPAYIKIANDRLNSIPSRLDNFKQGA
jgi:DNA modification methylase